MQKNVTAIVGSSALWSMINDTPPFMIWMSLNDKKITYFTDISTEICERFLFNAVQHNNYT